MVDVVGSGERRVRLKIQLSRHLSRKRFKHEMNVASSDLLRMSMCIAFFCVVTLPKPNTLPGAIF